MFDFSDFNVQRAVFEIRYDNAVLLWDRTGAVFADVKRDFPNLQLRNIAPNAQVVRLSPTLEMTLQVDKLFFLSAAPSKDFAELKKALGGILKAILKKLEIADLTRVGMRTFFVREMSKAKSAEYIVANLPFLKRRGRHFGFEATVSDPEIALRWEGETLGCLVRANTLDMKLNYEIPLEFGGKDTSMEKTGVCVDVDFYTRGLTAVSQFNAPMIVDNWQKLIRRDLGGFLNG